VTPRVNEISIFLPKLMDFIGIESVQIKLLFRKSTSYVHIFCLVREYSMAVVRIYVCAIFVRSNLPNFSTKVIHAINLNVPDYVGLFRVTTDKAGIQ
jgi:hypothetical protein